MSNTLTLGPQGTGGCLPDPLTWTPTKNSAVTITNNSGSPQNLTDITNGVLKDSSNPPKVVTETGNIAAGGSWSGSITGNTKATYKYQNGDGTSGLSTGNIDPS